MTIQELIQKLATKGDEVYSIAAKVKEISESERTCDVEPLDSSADIFGVRLQPVLSDDKGICIFPKVGSTVLVTFLNKTTGYVALCSEVDKVELKIGQQELIISDQGVELKGFLKLTSNSDGLKNVLDTLFDKLMSAVLITPAGNGSFDPAFITEIGLLKSAIATFLK